MTKLFKELLQTPITILARLYEWAQRHTESEIKTVLDALLAMAEDQPAPKKVVSITATYYNVCTPREVVVNEVNYPFAEIRAKYFENSVDSAAWYHGFWTRIENLYNVYVHYADGTRKFVGDPLINFKEIPT